VTGYWLEGRGSVPGGHPPPYPMGTVDSSVGGGGGKRLGREDFPSGFHLVHTSRGVELYFQSPMCLHVMVLNQLSTGRDLHSVPV
jgi:hypothetical protein